VALLFDRLRTAHERLVCKLWQGPAVSVGRKQTADSPEGRTKSALNQGDATRLSIALKVVADPLKTMSVGGGNDNQASERPPRRCFRIML